MVKTGFIQIIEQTTSGGTDAEGNWLPVVKEGSELFPCNVKTLQNNYKMVVNGQEKVMQFSIYIEARFLSTYNMEEISEIVLFDNRNNETGTFQLQNTEYLELTKKIKLIV